MIGQLPLNIRLKQDVSFDTFVTGHNREVLTALDNFLGGAAEQFLYLWGQKGVGKTHLLQAACAQADAQGQTVGYVPLEKTSELEPRIMEDLERLDLACVDDIQTICADPNWEQALFNLFNRLREKGSKLVIAASTPGSKLPMALPDLKSRLTWGPSYRVVGLDDNERLEFLIQSARHRGLELSRDTGLYLLRRCPRDPDFLHRLVDHLDRYSMAAQRRLTIPLVREALTSFNRESHAPWPYDSKPRHSPPR